LCTVVESGQALLRENSEALLELSAMLPISLLY
jgi:hypothetical protein